VSTNAIGIYLLQQATNARVMKRRELRLFSALQIPVGQGCRLG